MGTNCANANSTTAADINRSPNAILRIRPVASLENCFHRSSLAFRVGMCTPLLANSNISLCKEK